jgi:hypothetical protein
MALLTFMFVHCLILSVQHFVYQNNNVSKKHYCYALSWRLVFRWGYSSVGRAPALQAGGHEFESHYLHHFL